MKKLFSLLIVLLIIPFSCNADTVFSIDGEWFSALTYSTMGASAKLSENGDLIATLRDTELTFHPNGIIEYPGEIINSEVLELSEDAFLFYILEENAINGYLLIRSKEENFKCYMVTAPALLLLINGKAIRYGSGETADYMRVDDWLYMTDKKSYSRGKIKEYGNNMFIYFIETEQEEERVPMMVFVRSTAVQ